MSQIEDFGSLPVHDPIQSDEIPIGLRQTAVLNHESSFLRKKMQRGQNSLTENINFKL